MPLLTVIFSSEENMFEILFGASIPLILHSIRKSEGRQVGGPRTVQEVIRRNAGRWVGRKQRVGSWLQEHTELETQGQDQGHRSGKKMNALVFEEWLTGKMSSSLYGGNRLWCLTRGIFFRLFTQTSLHGLLFISNCPTPERPSYQWKLHLQRVTRAPCFLWLVQLKKCSLLNGYHCYLVNFVDGNCMILLT